MKKVEFDVESDRDYRKLHDNINHDNDEMINTIRISQELQWLISYYLSTIYRLT